MAELSQSRAEAAKQASSPDGKDTVQPYQLILKTLFCCTMEP